jgi:hypothetical protein
MRKIWLTAALTNGLALALLAAACTAPDGADAGRNGGPAQAANTGAAPPAAATPGPTARGPQQAPGDVVRRVTPAELKGMMDRGEAVVVDVRSKEDYAGGHVRGALSIPRGETAARVSELPKDKLIVFYCA